MKKNLRIVSVATALLAVAPVAAGVSSVSTADSTAATTATQEVTNLGTLKGTIVLDRGSNTQFSVKLSDAQKDAILQLGGADLSNAKPEDMKDIAVKSATGQKTRKTYYFEENVQLKCKVQKLHIELYSKK